MNLIQGSWSCADSLERRFNLFYTHYRCSGFLEESVPLPISMGLEAFLLSVVLLPASRSSRCDDYLVDAIASIFNDRAPKIAIY